MAEISLVELIRDKQRRLQAFESEVARLKAELIEAKTMLFGATIQPVSREPERTSMEMAEGVLRRNGRRPMHVNQILSAIERDYGTPVKYATLVGNLSRHVKNRAGTFVKTGPNMFGLLAWTEETEDEDLFRREAAEQEG